MRLTVHDAHFITSTARSNPDGRLPLLPTDLWTILFKRLNNYELNTPWVATRRLAAQFNIAPCFAFGRTDPLAATRYLVSVFSELSEGSVTDTRKRAENAISKMVKQAYGRSAIDTLEHLPIGLAAPLREAARTCQLSPVADWPGAVFQLIGRNDLAEGISAPELLYSHGYKSVKENFVSDDLASFNTYLLVLHRNVTHPGNQ